MGSERSPPADFSSRPREPFRRLALVLLLFSFPSFFFGTGYVLIGWALSAAAYLLLLRNAPTRQAAGLALVVLVVCILSALLFDGTIKGVPRLDQSPAAQRVGGAMGGFATWFAASTLVALTPVAAPRAVRRVGSRLSLGGFVVASSLVLLGEPSLPDVGSGTLFGITFILSAIGSLLVGLALLSELIGLRGMGRPGAVTNE